MKHLDRAGARAERSGSDTLATPFEPEAPLQHRAFEVLGCALANQPAADLPIAVARAGHVGLLDLEFTVPSGASALTQIEKLASRAAGHSWGLKLRAADCAALARAAGPLLDRMAVAIVTGLPGAAEPSAAVNVLRAAAPGARILAELQDVEGLPAAETAGVDGIVAKGHEAGGPVGQETAFLLTQRLVAASPLPVIAQGGVAPDSAAAFLVAGAAGVLLDWQLALFDVAQTPQGLARAISSMDGSETRCLGSDIGRPVRVFWRADHKPSQMLADVDGPGKDPQAFDDGLRKAVDPWQPETSLWLMGQDAALAKSFRQGHSRIGPALDALRDAALERVRLAAELHPLAEGAPLARTLGTRYPVVQGPMTRVSDCADFALAVAEGGALPFLALALMRRPEAETLLAETKARMGDRPWGVGILGFVDDALREEQTAAIAVHRPSYALIAGGRPDQALALERQGIPTFLHVPAPGLLKLFLEAGVRRFIFEGRECGGHVGPRSSAVLWQQAIDTLLDHYGPNDTIDCDLLFAGGIHDARSGAMVSALGAGLAARGARIGALVGTAYILTREAVETGAVVEGYQRLVLGTRQTVLLESGAGHATRVVTSPIVAEFLAEKARMRAEGLAADEVRDRLERFNVGRSRIASKGLDRNPDHGRVSGAEKLMAVSPDEQFRRGLYMIGQAAALHDAPTTIAALHADICRASADILAAARDRATPRPMTGAPEGPGARIAITGIGTFLPGARDLASYWENILDKVDVIEEVPERRWDWRRYYDEDREAPDRIYSKWGGFLDEIDFDPLRYGIPPKSVPSIEPLQLLALETVRQALESAGFPEGRIEDAALRRRTSVIIGVGGGAGPLGQRYAVRASMPAVAGGLSDTAEERLPDWTEDSFPGILINVIAGRVANRFDLGGVNFTVDAACGSSLAAVMLAARELESGTSDMVIVGGADSFQNPFDFLAFSKTRALSPRGRCRTFDAGADGIAISEGLAMIVLRRLDDAEAAGDRIYAVLRGVAGSSDGRDLSLTAPRPEGQQEALRRAYSRAGISPGTVGLVEAHGTGTVVGDRTEIRSLSAVFSEARSDRQFCGVGSVKSMIGHTKAAAGCAGLAKAALALHHRVLPATLHVEQPNPSANFPQSPFYVQTETRPWLRNGPTPRRAGVSAFGFGGTNFHAVLEEYDNGYLPEHQEPFRRNWSHELYLFSGADPTALAERLQAAARALSAPPEGLRAADVAASLHEAFDPKASARLAMVAPSLPDAARRLARAADALLAPKAEAGLRAIDAQGCFYSSQTPFAADQVAFLFPGQGSQYPGMAADLAMTFPEFRERLEWASEVLAGRTPAMLGALIHPRPTLDPDEAAEQAAALKRTDIAQPAIGAVSLAMLELLRGFGLEARSFAGHSFGEYTALHAAGAFDATTLLRLAHARGDAIIRAGGSDLGSMVAVNAEAQALRAALGPDAGVTVANLNAPDQTVLAGPTPAIVAAVSALTALGLAAQRLPVACGFHSGCVAPARDLLAGALEAAAIRSPEAPVYSNATARPYPAAAAEVRARLAAHLTDPVDFMGMVRTMYDDGARLFVEVGPSAVLSRLTDRILEGQPHLAVASDVRRRSGVQQLLSVLGGAAAAGLPLQLRRLWHRRQERAVDVTGWTGLAPAQNAHRATLWKLDAANARPVDGVPQKRGFAARIEEDTVYEAPRHPVATAAPAGLDLPMRAAVVAPPAMTLASEPQGIDVTEAVIRRHQELMGQFLNHNRDVMLAWLGSTNLTAQGQPRLVLPQAQPQSAAPEPALALAAATTEPATPVPLAPKPVVRLVGSVEPSAAPPAAVAPRITAAAATAALLALIADRTGYPSEMLGGELDLEADLGIDSIKRVEILGALRRQMLGELAEAAHELMGPVSRERTVNGIVTRFLEVAEACGPEASPARAAPPAAVPVHATSVPVPDMTEWNARFVMVPQDVPTGPTAPWVQPGATYVITDDGAGLATALAVAIEGQGGRSLVLHPTLGLDDQTLRARVAALPGRVAGLIHLAPLAAVPDVANLDGAGWAAEVDRSTRTFFTLLSALGRDLSSRADAVVLCATELGGAFGFDGGVPANPAAAGAPGLLKSVAKEWPLVHCRAVDFDSASDLATRLAALQEEAGRRSPGDVDQVEIGRPADGRRLILLAEPRPVAPTELLAEEMGPEAVFLVTGGARGITARITRALAKASGARFVLLGSTPAPDSAESSDTAGLTDLRQVKAALVARAQAAGRVPTPATIESEYLALLKAREIRAALADIEAAGGRVEYHACDVRDSKAFSALIAEVRARYGRLDGVVHGAGLIEDKLVVDKTPDSFERVLRTKTDSAFTLFKALPREGLRFVLFFTSVAGRFGNQGQADYGAANEIVSKLARRMDADGHTRVIAVSWGPWDSAGMVSPEVRARFDRLGIEPIPPERGEQAVLLEVSRSAGREPEVVWGRGPWDQDATRLAEVQLSRQEAAE